MRVAGLVVLALLRLESTPSVARWAACLSDVFYENEDMSHGRKRRSTNEPTDLSIADTTREVNRTDTTFNAQDRVGKALAIGANPCYGTLK